jgi:hypothetical protein
MVVKKRPLIGEQGGFIIAEPMRSAIAETLHDAAGPMFEEILLNKAMDILVTMKWKAKPGDVRQQLGRLHGAGIIEPLAVGGELHYRLTKEGQTVTQLLFERQPG